MDVEAKVLDLIRRTACELPSDILEALQAAKEQEHEVPAQLTLDTIAQNCALACHQHTPMCQDTGTLTFFWKVPAGTAQRPLIEATAVAVRQATQRGWLRKNTIDTLSGASVDDNVAEGIPVHHFEEADVAHPEVTLLLKGGGSENMSCQYSLPDARLGAGRDLAGVRACVLDAVNRIQGQGCSPGILGICIGADRAEGYAVAKQQLLRRLDDVASNPVLAELEGRLLTEANTLGVGPMGLGGKTTLLGVKMAARTRLPASYFVTIAYCCWACRRQTAILN
ncbi:MAG: fumarate hydratase [Kiritimatiellae bacterium]|nr:fumarate hydratase [Kiritimatiellia bacterium]